MQANPVWPLWFAYLFLVAAAFQLKTRWMTRVGIFSALLVGMLMRYGFAVPFSDGINPSVTHIAISQMQLTEYYVAVALVYPGLLAGVLLCDWAWSSAGLHARAFAPAAPNQALLLGLTLLTFGVVFVVWIVLPFHDFVAGLGTLIPGLHTAADYRTQRVVYGSETNYATSSLAYLGSFARFAMAGVLVWVLYFYRRRSQLLAVAFMVGFVLLTVIGLASGQKMPALLLLGSLGLAILIERGRPSIVDWRLGLLAVAFVMGVVPALYHLQYPTWSYGQILSGTVGRLTEEYSRSAQLRFIYYPDLHPYLHGLSSFMVRGSLHLLGVDTSSGHSPETYIPAHTPGAGPNYGGTWNAGFFADAWADFSWAGVIGSSILIGAMIRAVDRWFDQCAQGPAEMGVYVAMCVAAVYVSEVATLTLFWTHALISGFLLYALLWIGRWPRHAEAEPSGRSLRVKFRA